MSEHPLALVAAARELLAASPAAAVGVWPRAAALLARQGLELSLRRYWERRAPGLERTSMRCQLLSLPAFIPDRPLTERASHAWWALSRATHHHEYELPPTHAELELWLRDAWDVAGTIERS